MLTDDVEITHLFLGNCPWGTSCDQVVVSTCTFLITCDLPLLGM